MNLKRYFSDLWAVIQADGIDLDKTEEAALGGPRGETISLWSAIEARHGYWLACFACLFFTLMIQWDHCHKQLLDEPMTPWNYVRAIICLIVVPALLIWLILFFARIIVGSF